MISRCFISVFLISLQCVKANLAVIEDVESTVVNDPEDAKLQFCELATKYGFKCVTYHVITKDGYNLTLFNICGNRSRLIFFQHGFLDSADTWLLRTVSSWVAFLANKFDLWFGNVRGNMYSRHHVRLDPDCNPEFWDFSFHEMAIFDVPAMVDFILETTGQTQLQAICHSQGTTLMFVLACIKPEYNAKFKIVVCLAPIAFMGHAEWPLFPLLSLVGGSSLTGAVGFIARGELLSNGSALVSLIQTACTLKLVGYAACGLGLASVLFGADPEQLEPSFTSIAFKHYTCGTSLMDAIHLLQSVQTNSFGQYDYGVFQNYLKYNSAVPPKYDLSKCTMPYAFVNSRNDRLSAVEDVERLKDLLPNVVEFKTMEPEQWNHIDFVWGRYMEKYLFGYVLGILNKYD